MPKFRKKPVVVDVDGPWRVAGDLATVVAPPHEMAAPCKHCGKLWQQHGWIDTLEGGHIVCPGDMIITGVAGEKYPCKPDIFEKTYEPTEAARGEGG